MYSYSILYTSLLIFQKRKIRQQKKDIIQIFLTEENYLYALGLDLFSKLLHVADRARIKMEQFCKTFFV
jgi:hypothetical protein